MPSLLLEPQHKAEGNMPHHPTGRSLAVAREEQQEKASVVLASTEDIPHWRQKDIDRIV